MSVEYVRIQIRRDSYSNWQSINPILGNGEFSLDTTNKMLKIGDGSTRWMDLDGFPADGSGFTGQSAYDLAVEAGFEGTEAEWLESLSASSIPHNELPGRSDPDAHPITAITGLTAELAAKLNYVELTESQYNALPVKDPTTLYIVSEDPV